ncbi:MAG: hypothetical protein NT166_27515 [Candidatus Aminicenantes bacterium]|nr:hypothetical protein [Candidatus Aminicenantes bacterium]
MKKIIKIVSFNIGLLVVLMVILEIFLRLAGVSTIVDMGKKAPNWKRHYRGICRKIATTKFKSYNRLYTDSEGIFKANPEYFSHSKNNPINRDGFRGNPFEYVDTPRAKLLLIGDSFTWGSTARPLTNCFADLLQQAGYYVYNGGIPGVDPQQYALIAKKYTPILKPDVVAVCLYLGNDVRSSPLIMQPNKNLYYFTNFGNLLGYDDNGNFFKDAQEAFLYFKNRKCGHCTDPWSYFLFKTVVGKAIYKILHHHQPVKFDPSRQWVTKALAEIQETCRLNSSRLMIFIIPVPSRNTPKNKIIEKSLDLFKEFQYYYPGDFQKSDYRLPPDCHFNNSGHRKYADFILGVLKQNGYDKEIKP